MFFEKGQFLVKTVENANEMEAVLRLRYDVFHHESLGKPAGGVDRDEFDSMCDHLAIIDKKTGSIVGTYRFITSTYSDRFYSESEFELGSFLSVPGVKLEMGRACVSREYRTGFVLNLLWRGVVQYIASVDANYLFGCASIKTTDSLEIASIHKYLKDGGHLSEEFLVTPKPTHTIAHLPEFIALVEEKKVGYHPERVQSKIPPLFESYLKAGAKVCGLPALDPEFGCVDFFTVLKIADLQGVHRRRYQPS